MMYWIYDLPNWLVLLLFAGVFVGLACGGTLLFRQRAQRWFGSDLNELIINVLKVGGVFYGLLLGLVALATLESFAESDTTVSNEAAALSTLYQEASHYPEPLRSRLQTDIRDYTRRVIKVDWPAQQRGEEPRVESADKIQTDLLTFRPETRADQVLHTLTLEQYSKYTELRRKRIAAATHGLPAELWWVLVLGVLISIVLSWLLTIEKRSAHLVFAGGIAFFLAIMVFLIAAMDYPFRGELSIDPDAFEIAYRTVMGGG